jgi:aminoglycoside phosphotransferase (APT) family kinase protein
MPLMDHLKEYLSVRFPDAVMSDFQFMTGGWECDIYSFNLNFSSGKRLDLILRLYLRNDGGAKSAQESEGLRRLYEAGYPVPELLLYEMDTTVLGKPFVIMEKLDGQSMWSILASTTPEHEQNLLDHFSRLLAQLHRLDWSQFTEQPSLYRTNPEALLDELINRPRQHYQQFGVEGFLKVAYWLEHHKTAVRVQPAVVHLDFHANNVFLCRDGQIKVIDWSQITVSDYRADLSWTLLIMGDYGKPEWRDHILATYRQAAGHAAEDLDYFNVINYVKLLADAVISLRVGAEKIGLRPESVETTRQQLPILRQLYRKLQAITGLTIAEVESAFDGVS